MCQAIELAGGKIRGRGKRMNTRMKEGFIGVDIPDSGDQALIQEDGFDRRSGLTQTGGEGFSRAVERIRAETTPFDRSHGDRGIEYSDAAEAANVPEDEPCGGLVCTVLDAPCYVDMVLTGQPLVRRNVPQLAGHSKADGNGRPVFSNKSEFLAVSDDAGDGPAAK